jgi:uridine kinase
MFESALAYELQSETGCRAAAARCLWYLNHRIKRLLAFLEWFLPIDGDLIPDNSILREFRQVNL